MSEQTQSALGVKVRDEGMVRVISLHRPESKNGLTLEVCTALADALDEASKTAGIRAVALWGDGGAFCSGLDLKAAVAIGAGAGDPATIQNRMRNHFHRLIRSVRACEKPVVAIVDGPAVGFGCDLAFACDLRVGSERARFGEVFVKRGLIPDGGGTYTLQRLVGTAKALELMLIGDLVEAKEALSLGLLNRIVAAGEGDAKSDAGVSRVYLEGVSFAQRLAAGPPIVLKLVKELVYAAQDSSMEEALEREVTGQTQCLNSQDFFEGMTAFFSKRPAVFTGK